MTGDDHWLRATTGAGIDDLGASSSDAQSLDMIAAICPNCHILLIEANSTGQR